jgi:hypothetical protein
MARITTHLAATALLASLVTGCSGGGGDTPVQPPPLQTPTASISLGAATGTVQAGATTTSTVTLTRGGGFTGDVALAVTGAPTGVTVAGQTIAAGATSATLSIVTTAAAVPGTSTLTIAGTGTGVTITPQTLALTITAPAQPIAQIGTDITNSDLNFGAAIALSTDGTRMVVAANGSANGTTRVYQRSGTTWTQLGADIVGEAAGDLAGTGVDINAAGTRIAVGAQRNSGAGAANGHIRVYDLVGSTWTQIGADIDGSILNSGLGWRIALSASGNRLIAGGPNLFTAAGYAQVFDLVGTTWTQVGATLTGTSSFGWDVDISSDGSTIAVSSPQVPSSGGPGSVQVFRLNGSTWTQVGNVISGTITTPVTVERFGEAISLTANGSRIAIGAPTAPPAGANSGIRGQVRVFDLVGSTWTQVGSSVGGTDLAGVGDGFGFNLMISDDGTRFAASAVATSRGRVYTLTGGAWAQTGADFGTTGAAARSEGIALSADGRTTAIGLINGTPKRVSVFSITP